MKECEHIIGILYDYDNTNIVTFEELKQKVERENKVCASINERYGNNYKITPLNDYLDSRKSVNFAQFNYCCNCGAKIDWARLRKIAKEYEA